MLPINKKHKKKIKSFLAVSGIIMLGLVFSLFVLMILMDVTEYGISIASFAATLFMIFAQPKSKTVTYRNLFGAYLIAALSSVVAIHLAADTSLSAGLSILVAFVFMTLLGMQHAPAIGLNIALVLNRFSEWKIIAVLLGVFLLIYIAKTLYMILNNPERVTSLIGAEDRDIEFKFRSKKKAEYIMMK